MLALLSGSKYFTALDPKIGYWQVNFPGRARKRLLLLYRTEDYLNLIACRLGLLYLTEDYLNLIACRLGLQTH